MHLKSAIGHVSLLALLACGASSLQGCTGDRSQEPSEDRSIGELSMLLQLSEDVTLSTVSYEIRGNGFFKAGTVEVSQTEQIAFQVYGIPPGQGYTIALHAGDSNDGFSCSGSTSFSITAGKVSEARVVLQCALADAIGGVSVNATVNLCPTLADLTALPASVFVGGTIELSASAHDSDGPQAISYAWTSTLGSLSGEDSAHASLECTSVGTGSVTLEYSDGDCSGELSVPVSCTRLPIASSPVRLSAGTNHACSLRTDGRAICWGGNTGSGLGFETIANAAANPQQTASFVDTRALPRGLEATWKSISVGDRHTCGISSSGAGYCWGPNQSGELGSGALNEYATTPRPIDSSMLPSGTTWSLLTSGSSFTCGITADSVGYCWGASGRLGIGAFESRLTPSPIDMSALPQGTSWSVLSAGSAHACGITKDGAAFCWGSDANGRLGNGPALTGTQASPTPVDLATLPSGTTWATISAGDSHTCGVTTAGELYCWGSDGSGKLGDGNPTVTDQDHPSLVSPGALRSGARWISVTAGKGHTCGLSTDRAAYCWGAAGPLGNGTNQGSPSPVAVDVSLLPAGTEWAMLDAGDNFSCGLTVNGALYCWGSDTDGHLGNGPSVSIERAPNTSVVTAINVVSISAGLLPGAFIRSLTGAAGDPTNPVLSFSLIPLDTPVEDLVVTVQSSNEAVVSPANVTFSGRGSERVAAIAPVGVGTTTLTFVVSDPSGNQTAFPIVYAGSGVAPEASGRYHMGISDASTAIDVGDGYMVVADDETNLLYLYKQDESGYPIKTWNYRADTFLGQTERDIEAAARLGDLIVWTGSQGNARDGATKEYRRTIFATRIMGSGADVELEFAGRYGGGGNKKVQATIGLWPDLLSWDQANGHSLGANFLGFVAASKEGVLPNAPNGFNVEGFEFAANGTTGYLGFRAPTINLNGTQHALIVPVTNILDLVNGIPTQQVGLAQFGAPIFLDLAGRSIRELRRNDSGEYLISAGPPDNPTVGVNDTWALYVWDGDATHVPVLNRLLPNPDMLTGGVWEGIVSVPSPLASGAPVRFVCDSGDTRFYGESLVGDYKSYSQIIKLR